MKHDMMKRVPLAPGVIALVFALVLVAFSALLAQLLTPSAFAAGKPPGGTVKLSLNTATFTLNSNNDTATPVPTDTPTPMPTDTATPVPTGTPTPVPTDTPILTPTNTSIPTPTPRKTPGLTPTASVPLHVTPTAPPRPSPGVTATASLHPTSVSGSSGWTPTPSRQRNASPLDAPVTTQWAAPADNQLESILVALGANIAVGFAIALLVGMNYLGDKVQALRKHEE